MTPIELSNLAARYPLRDLGDGNIRTCPVRLSYAHLFKPTTFKAKSGAADPNAKPRYSVTCLFPAGVELAPLTLAMLDVLKNVYGPTTKLGAQNGDKIAIEYVQNGKPARKQTPWALMDQGYRDSDGYEAGSACISAHAYSAPRLRDSAGQPTSDTNVLYSGCYAFVVLKPYWAKHWDRLSIGLEVVRKVADGERFGGSGISVEDAFADVGDELTGQSLADMMA
jgi:hypothetical protein